MFPQTRSTMFAICHVMLELLKMSVFTYAIWFLVSLFLTRLLQELLTSLNNSVVRHIPLCCYLKLGIINRDRQL